jgi:hypothetical protein
MPQPSGLLCEVPTNDLLYVPGTQAWYCPCTDPVTVYLPRWPVGVGLWVQESTYRAVAPGCSGVSVATYRADNRPTETPWTAKNSGLPPRYMKRELARTLLTVTAVRAERVNEISERDALAEGVLPRELTPGGCLSALAAYHDLWDSLHGKKPGERFQDGPFVWVYELRRITTDFKEAQAILKGTAG